MSGGSRMWQSASTMRYFDMEILPGGRRGPRGNAPQGILQFPDARVNSDEPSETAGVGSGVRQRADCRVTPTSGRAHSGATRARPETRARQGSEAMAQRLLDG